MKFQELKIVKDWVIGLVYDEKNNSYSLLLAKYKDIKLQYTEELLYDNFYDMLDSITKGKTGQIIIPFKEYNNHLFTLVTLNNKKEYENIISTLEVVL